MPPSGVTVEALVQSDGAADVEPFVARFLDRPGVRIVARSGGSATLMLDPSRIHILGPQVEAAASQCGAILRLPEIDAQLPTEGLGGRPSPVWAAIGDAFEDIRLARLRGTSEPGLLSRVTVRVTGGTRFADRLHPLAAPQRGRPGLPRAVTEAPPTHQPEGLELLSEDDLREIDRAADVFEATIARRFGTPGDPWAHRRPDLKSRLPTTIDGRVPRVTSRVGAEDEPPDIVRVLQALGMDPREVGIATAIVLDPTVAITLYEVAGQEADDVRRVLSGPLVAPAARHSPEPWTSLEKVAPGEARAIMELEGAIALVVGAHGPVERLLRQLIERHP